MNRQVNRPRLLDLELHDIGWAVRQLKADRIVTREEWNGKGQLLAMIRPDRESEMDVPYIYIIVDKKRVPWLASQTDLLAEDWELV